MNARSAWLAIKHAAALRARGGGSVVITSSVAGVIAVPGTSPHVISKRALTGLAKAAAAELAPDNIRVNTVNPAPVESRMMRQIEHGLCARASALGSHKPAMDFFNKINAQSSFA